MICIVLCNLLVETLPEVQLVFTTVRPLCCLEPLNELANVLLTGREDRPCLQRLRQQEVARVTQHSEGRQCEESVWYFCQQVVVQQHHLQQGLPAQRAGDEDQAVVPYQLESDF